MADFAPFLFEAVPDDDDGDGGAGVRPYAFGLPTQPAAPPVRSPWSPSTTVTPQGAVTGGAAPPSPPSPASIDELAAVARAEAVAAGRAEGLAAGRAEGLAALEAQRQKLVALGEQLTRAHAARTAGAADTISTAAVAVIEAWLGRAITGADRFAPIVAGWLAASGGTAATDGAIALVNPADVAAMREAVGAAPIAVAADPAIAPGDCRISVGARELAHTWSERLGELREAIAASVATPGANPAEPTA